MQTLWIFPSQKQIDLQANASRFNVTQIILIFSTEICSYSHFHVLIINEYFFSLKGYDMCSIQYDD